MMTTASSGFPLALEPKDAPLGRGFAGCSETINNISEGAMNIPT